MLEGSVNGDAMSMATWSQNNEKLTLKRRQQEKLEKKLGHFKQKEKFDVIDGKRDTQYVSMQLKVMYILHCSFKILIEFLFLWGNYALQVQQSQKYDFGVLFFGESWVVPEKYTCKTHEPHVDPETGDPNWYSQLFFDKNLACAQQEHGVTCWISRPNEKTFFLRYMI